MAGVPIPPSDLQHRVIALERELAHARQQIDRLLELRTATVVAPQQVRVVETFASDPEEYPEAPANAFNVRFLDTSLDTWTAGDRTQTFTPRSASSQGVASTLNGGYVSNEQRALAVLLNEHWWLLTQQPAKLFMRCSGVIAGRDSTTGAMTKGAVVPLYKNTSHILANDVVSPPAVAPSEVYNPTLHDWSSNLVIEAWQDARGVWFGRPLWEKFEGINVIGGRPTASFASDGLLKTANAAESLTSFVFPSGGSSYLADISSNKIRLRKPGSYRLTTSMKAITNSLTDYAQILTLAYVVGGTTSRRLCVQNEKGYSTDTYEFWLNWDLIVTATSADYVIDFHGAAYSPTWTAGGFGTARANFILNLFVLVEPLF